MNTKLKQAAMYVTGGVLIGCIKYVINQDVYSATASSLVVICFGMYYTLRD